MSDYDESANAKPGQLHIDRAEAGGASMKRTLSERFLVVGMAILLTVVAVWTLVVARNVLVPFAIALMIWFLLCALADGFSRIKFGTWQTPPWLCLLLAVVIVLGALALLGDLVGRNVVAVVDAAPRYEANVERLLEQISLHFDLEEPPTIAALIERIDLRKLAGRFAAAAAMVAGSAGMILVYILFLLVEQRIFGAKLVALIPDAQRRLEVEKVLQRIEERINTYLRIKTLMSVLTGALSYAVLIVVGIDLAEFWAVIIFLLNYIPNVGSLLGVTFPALMALVQFPSLAPFLGVVVALGLTQMLIGSVLEPRLAGRSLNISPLVVILALVFWSNIWGIVGAILCVPITVIAMIILAQFPTTRAIAMFLSADGRID